MAPHKLPGCRLGLLALGAGLVGLCVAVEARSSPFADEAPGRPILEVVGCLTAATLLYLVALAVVFRKQAASDGWTILIVLGYSGLFRLLLLPSTPILEIDFYRYLWDGRVALHGVNPYRYSPLQVEQAGWDEPAPDDLGRLAQLSQQSEAMREIFGRVHYRGVPTVYPPVAQGVFAAAAFLTPTDAPTATQILILKAILVFFDLATLGLVVGLLRLVRLPSAWCLSYGWCPLVLKEIANSGHLDSIAVFFSVLAIFLLVAAIRYRRSELRIWIATAGGASLALGVLAKTYPLLLLPVVMAFLAARWGRRAVIPLAAFALTLVAGYLPFCGRGSAGTAEANHPGTGLGTFLTQWETNDLVFMLVYHNFRRPEEGPGHWFVAVPGSWRTALHDRVLDPLREEVNLSPRVNPAFVLSQMLLGLLLLGLCLHWARLVYREPEPMTLLRAVFRCLVWGWLLSSAQNPWYLTWCLPFMVFDGRVSWFLLPGFALLYYVRFWFDERSAANAFDYGLIWLEYVPFFFLLAAETWWKASRLIPALSVSEDAMRERRPPSLALGAGSTAP